VGLGGAPGEYADYEWVDLAEVPAPRRPAEERPGGPARRRGRGATTAATEVVAPAAPAAPEVAAPPAESQAWPDEVGDPDEVPPDALGAAVVAWLARDPLWGDDEGEGPRVLLADLDNLRAGGVRWRARMAVVVALARQADVVGIAGQHGAARRAAPHLAEWAPTVRAVDDGSDLADHELLAVAAAVPASAGPLRVLCLSNDGIFADLADRGRLVVVSPGADALSERLDGAADDVVDLAALEGALAAELAAGA